MESHPCLVEPTLASRLIVIQLPLIPGNCYPFCGRDTAPRARFWSCLTFHCWRSVAAAGRCMGLAFLNYFGNKSVVGAQKIQPIYATISMSTLGSRKFSSNLTP